MLKAMLCMQMLFTIRFAQITDRSRGHFDAFYRFGRAKDMNLITADPVIFASGYRYRVCPVLPFFGFWRASPSCVHWIK